MVARWSPKLSRCEEMVAGCAPKLSGCEEMVARWSTKLSRCEEMVARWSPKLPRCEEIVARSAIALNWTTSTASPWMAVPDAVVRQLVHDPKPGYHAGVVEGRALAALFDVVGSAMRN